VSPLASLACVTYQAVHRLTDGNADIIRHKRASQAAAAVVLAACGRIATRRPEVVAPAAADALGPSPEGVWDWEAFVLSAVGE
jgi:hypothetical protein